MRLRATLLAVVASWVSAAAPCGAQQFVALRTVDAGGMQPHVLAADIDGNGTVDLVVTHPSGVGSKVKLLINDGSGRFVDESAKRIKSVHAFRGAPLAFDADGDGDVDLYFSIPQKRSELWINDGRGNFANEGTKRLPNRLDSLVFAHAIDLERDGDLDVILIGFAIAAGFSHVLVNDGKGNFKADFARLPKGLFAPRARIADFDRDGDDDVLISDPKPKLLFNDGKGALIDVTAQKLRAGALWMRTLAVADFDKDGDLDVLCGRDGRAARESMLVNDGKGTLTESHKGIPSGPNKATDRAVVGDFDLNGTLDVVMSYRGETRLVYWSGDGRGAFVDISTRIPTQLPRYGGLVGPSFDAEGDGDDDFLVRVFAGPVSLHINLERQLVINGTPRLGQVLPIDIARRPRFAPRRGSAFVFASLARLPRSVTLPGVGQLWLDPRLAIFVASTRYSAPAGFARIGFQIPSVSALRGREVSLQAVHVEATSPPLTIGNVDHARIR